MHSYTLGDGTTLAYRAAGDPAAFPLVMLHGGWGNFLFGFDEQIDYFARHYHVLAPDRRGYGRSSRVNEFPLDFHQLHARDMLEWLRGIGAERAFIWGHSDGAVIAAYMALLAPQRVSALVLEGPHFHRYKAIAQEFFLRARDEPDRFGPLAARTLAAEHGEGYWRKLISTQAAAWLTAQQQGGDVFNGRLHEIAATPTLIVYGEQDDFTTRDEVGAMMAQLPQAELALYPEGGHCPHGEPTLRDAVHQRVADFLSRHER